MSFFSETCYPCVSTPHRGTSLHNRRITIRHPLNHRSNMVNHTNYVAHWGSPKCPIALRCSKICTTNVTATFGDNINMHPHTPPRTRARTHARTHAQVSLSTDDESYLQSTNIISRLMVKNTFDSVPNYQTYKQLEAASLDDKRRDEIEDVLLD